MPYIRDVDKRYTLDIRLGRAMALCKSEGELNYAITRLCDEWLFFASEDSGVHYSGLNAVIGVLECAKQEFYRRLVAIYEDKQKELNGDVYKSHW